jgi:hypothetical protein
MVNTFFDGIAKMSDHLTFSFIESLKQEIDAVMQVVQISATETATCFTLLQMMLRRLNPIEGAFANVLLFTKQIISRLSDASQFNTFFEKHLFRSYCALIKECPSKRQQACELMYAHCAHDMQMRIRVVQGLKKHLRDDELVYCCQAYLLQQEVAFNEQWFDVFLYYALIGLSNQRVGVRVYAINILCTIAKHNPEAMLEVCDKVSALADEQYWEIKT